MPDGTTELLSGFVGVVIGFLSSFAVFRARFTAIEKDIEYIKKSLEDGSGGEAKFWDDLQRRQKIEVEILANIARKLGVSHRLTDLGGYIDRGEDK